MSGDATLEELCAVLPEWLPEAVIIYIAHYEKHLSIRAIARVFGVQPSTISRRIKTFETKLPDALTNSGVRRITSMISRGEEPLLLRRANSSSVKENRSMSRVLHDELFRSQHKTLLKTLCEEDAGLFATANLDRIVVGKIQNGKFSNKMIEVECAVAEAMALCGTIRLSSHEKILKYVISPLGRKQNADQHERATRRRRYLTRPRGRSTAEVEKKAPPTGMEILNRLKSMYEYIDHSCEPPINILSRLDDKSGKGFLTEELVKAGRRFREDFELSCVQCSLGARDNKTGSNTASGKQIYLGDTLGSFCGALEYLGPELSDVAVRCCCFLHGMERIEKDLNWSARSGKIVLRIALIQLKSYYSKSSFQPSPPLEFDVISGLRDRLSISIR